MRKIWIILACLFSNLIYSQEYIESDIIGKESKYSQVEGFVTVLDVPDIQDRLKAAPRIVDRYAEGVRIKLPFPDGGFRTFEIKEEKIVGDKIYKKYPQNRAYSLSGVDDPYLSGKMTVTPLGIGALIFTESYSFFIESIDGRYHKSYIYSKDSEGLRSCDADHRNFKQPSSSSSRTSIGGTIREYIIAVASTGEFSDKYGDNLATINAKILEYLALLNGIFQRDLAISFVLTEENDDIIFFDPATDGLDPNNRLPSAQAVISGAIPSNEYDFGHVFYEMPAPGGGGWTGSGVAGLSVVCNNSNKARGWTGSGGPYNSSWWMGTFAHEVGHQFGAPHTFYGTAGNCAGSQRSVGNGVEPGSGNSLMSYEGNCGPYGEDCTDQNIVPEAGFIYFHGYSIGLIQSFVSGSGSCYTSVSSGNDPPVVIMPNNVTIPKETPFYLEGSATDEDGDPLLYSWEEIDTDNLNLSCPNGAPDDAATSTSAPLFRSFDPSAAGAKRYFPQLSDQLNNSQTMGEILPEVGRAIDMRFTVRGDNGGVGGVTYEDMTVTVATNSGPFVVNTANTSTTYQAGDPLTVSWNVTNTNIPPVSCAFVNILFSFDGGETFPTTLLANTSNDGSAAITLPNTGTTQGRLKIEAVNNIFYDINDADITILSDCNPIIVSIINDEDVTADPGSPLLDLNLVVGSELILFAGDIELTDPSANLVGENITTGNCTIFGNTPHHEILSATVHETDTYNFQTSGSGFYEVLNIYNPSFNSNSECSNWLGSSAQWNPSTGGVSFINPYSILLQDGDIIEMVVSGFYSNGTGAFSVNITSNGSGQLIDNTLPAGYDVVFVISSNGIIEGIEADADLSDAGIYSGGEYTVEALVKIASVDFSSYVGLPLVLLKNDISSGAECGEFSPNHVTVNINLCTPTTKIVTSNLDNGGPNTLRSIIENACEDDNISFSPTLLNSTIVLNSEIDIDINLSIGGLGIDNLSISGNNSNRIFNISSGVMATISDLALINGYAPTNGGAFINNGNLSIENVRFVGNKSGAIFKAFTASSGTVSFAGIVQMEE